MLSTSIMVNGYVLAKKKRNCTTLFIFPQHMLFKVSNINQYTHKENTNIKRETQGELPLHMHVFPFHPSNQQENKRKKQSWLPSLDGCNVFEPNISTGPYWKHNPFMLHGPRSMGPIPLKEKKN